MVRSHDPRWAREFDLEAARLRAVLADLAPDIEHVGSTAVPGLAAKPLLDVALAFPDRDTLEWARLRLRELGYDDRGDWESAGGVILAKGPRSGRTHMLHLVEATDPQWARWLIFRDALRTDNVLREAYAVLKTELAARFPLDRANYVAGKRQFIETAIAARQSHS